MRYKLKCFLSFLSCIVIVPLVSAQSRQTVSADETQDVAKGPATPPFIVQPNDLLEIFVWKEPDLTRKVLVRPDGRISFPLIQDLQVAGLNPLEIKQEIEKKLQDYIELPNVTVIVEAIQSYRIFVTGKVTKPGVITSEKPITVLQALALAGGFQDFANLAEIVMVRNKGSDNLLFRFNYPDFIKGRNFSQNIILKSGDVIVVP
jgi:polysaccharide export outer membrane protein